MHRRNAVLKVVGTARSGRAQPGEGEPEEAAEACWCCWAYVDDLCKRFPTAVQKEPDDWCGEWQSADDGYDDDDEADDE